MSTIEVNVRDVVQNENSRAVYNPEELNQLMGSIQENGLLEPIGVRAIAKGKYEVVYGNRRFLAIKKLGWAKIEAKVVEADDQQLLVLNMIENLQRKDLTSMEEGLAFSKLKEEFGLTESEIAARVGVGLTRVKNSIEVHKNIPEEFAKKIVPTLSGKKKGRLTASNAVILNEISKSYKLTKSQTRNLFDRATQDDFAGPNVRLFGKLLSKGLDPDTALKATTDARSVEIVVMIEKKHAEKLERKYSRSIRTIVYEKLLMDAELKLIHSKAKRAKHIGKGEPAPKRQRGRPSVSASV
jgi:ParB/RepB/Spo0J family partition protein